MVSQPQYSESKDVSKTAQCPCGSRVFIRKTPVRGFWVEVVRFPVDGTHDVMEGTNDNLRNGKPPKTMECYHCGKRVQNQAQ
jgi:DNA-directed RNA polymerase subunit RPC12/RpoP